MPEKTTWSTILRDSEQAKAINEAKVAEGDQIIADAKSSG
jgi:hypothetical protein